MARRESSASPGRRRAPTCARNASRERLRRHGAQAGLSGGRQVLRLLPESPPDAVDPDTGRRYDDVIVFWVPDEGDKLALVRDDSSPFFITSHVDGHPSVLRRASRLGELSDDELVEVGQDAWSSRASSRRRDAWLREHRQPVTGGP